LALLERAAPVHVAGVRRYLIDPVTSRNEGPGGLAGLERGLARIEQALEES
jgi:hypothetical protein